MINTISSEIHRLLTKKITEPATLLADILTQVGSYYGDAYFLTTKSREKKLYKEVKSIEDTRFNFQVKFPPLSSKSCFHMPILSGVYLGNFLVFSFNPYTDDDVTNLIWLGNLITLLVAQIHLSDKQSQSHAKSTIGILTYSELTAALCIFSELPEDNLVVMGKFADSHGFSRSILGNAVRKIESSGAIETRSLGVKGTYIKIINEKFIEELGKLRV